MAIKLGTQTAGVMLVTGNGDLSPIALLDTDPIDPVSRVWSIFVWPDNIVSAPTVTSPTSNPASFTPPAAGEWYGVQLVRTLLVGTQTLQALICVPDATGTYALPPGGLPADTDPTKTLVNLNDDAKLVGWSGGERASLPGLSGAVRKALTDAAAATTPASTVAAGTQSAHGFIRAAGQALDVKEAGAVGNGSTDDRTALLAAATASDALRYSKGTGAYHIGSDTTIGTADTVHDFAPGAMLEAAGHTVTLRGQIPTGARQIFGAGIFLLPDMAKVEGAWWGALGDGVVTDDATPINKAVSCFGERGGKVHLHQPSAGFFACPAPIVISSASGVTIESDQSYLFSANPGGGVTLKATASFPAGRAVLEFRNSIKCSVKGVNFDPNGMADMCVNASFGVGSLPPDWQAGWAHTLSLCTFRNARVADVVSGQPIVEAAVSGDTWTIAGGATHTLAVGTQVYLHLELTSWVIPTGFSVNQAYFVRQTTGTTFKLATTNSDGTIVTASDHGAGRIIVAPMDTHDNSQLRLDACYFGNRLTGAGPLGTITRVFQHGTNTYETDLETCWFQGPIGSTGSTFTADSGTDKLTTTEMIYDPTVMGAERHPGDGDLIVLWTQTVGVGVLPSPLLPDTEYWVVNSGNDGTFKLAAAPGGAAINLTTNGSGTLRCLAVPAPYNHVSLIEGSLRMRACTTTAGYNRIFSRGRPNGTLASQGACLTDRDAASQDWRALDYDCTDTGAAPQIGGIEIDINHQNIFAGGDGGPFDGIRYRGRFGMFLDVAGSYSGNIKIYDVGHSSETLRSSAFLRFPMLLGINGFTPIVVGSDGTPATVPPWVKGGVSTYGVAAMDASTNRLVGKPIVAGDGTTDLIKIDSTSSKPRIQSLTNDLVLHGNSGIVSTPDALYAASFRGTGIAHVISDIGFVDLGDQGGGIPEFRVTASSAQMFVNGLLYDESVATPNITVGARTTDVPTNPFAITDCGPFASATGTNRSNGGIQINCLAAVGGATQKGLVIKVAGVTRLDTSGAKPSVTGALSAVIDTNAKTVLTSIVAALVAAGIATDGTT